MYNSQSLPRQRFLVPVLPPAIQNGAGPLPFGMMRPLPQPQQAPSEHEILRLRNDIDTLSEQLTEMRAQLCSACLSVDSRLSTALHTPFEEDAQPTPSPSRLLMSAAAMKPLQHMNVTLPRRELTMLNPLMPIRPPFPPPPKPQKVYAETSCSGRSQASTSSISITIRWNAVWTIGEESADSEENLLAFLQRAFSESVCWFEARSLLLFVNPYNCITMPTRTFRYSAISRLITYSLRQAEMIILFTGESGSGKSFLAEQAILGLVERTAKPNSVILGAIQSSILLLQALNSVTTPINPRSSRMVHWWEVNVKDGRLQRVVLRHFLSEASSKRCQASIFTTIASQMSSAEKEKFRISGFQLGYGTTANISLTDIKAALSSLCLPFEDAFRILAACALLNNLMFYEAEDGVDIENITDMEDAAFLLGLSALSLFKRLISRSVIVHKEEATGMKTLSIARLERDHLVAALYSRFVQTVIRRTNALLEISINNESEDGSVNDDSGMGSVTEIGSSRVDIIDICGLTGVNQRGTRTLHELCANMAAEKTRHFFMRTTLPHREVKETSLFMDFLKPKFGFFNIVDQACDNSRGSMQNVIEMVQQRKSDFTFIHVSPEEILVRHYEGRVPISYNITKIVENNRNTIRKEMVRLFDAKSTSFKLVASLFSGDLNAMAQSDQYQPRVLKCPAVDSDQTFSQQFLNKVDTLLKKCASRPHQIVHCMKTNNTCDFSKFNADIVRLQMKQWQLQKAISNVEMEDKEIIPPLDSKTIGIIKLPPERSYAIRNNRKHYFPQRRTMVVDYQDMTSGVSLRAGDVVNTLSFHSEDAYLIMTANDERAAVPCRFTEKSILPATVFNV
ncbi:unnamed protein product, partial [Mesorhabditis spiculigera]